MKINIGDIRITEEQKQVINDILDSSRLSEGEYTRKFEKSWATYIGTTHSIAVNSGTSALIAGITALKIKYGIQDNTNVITSPLTYIADANAIIHANLIPLFVDIDLDTFTINTDELERCVEENQNSSIIMPIHLMGYPCDMDRINKIAQNNDLKVIEDCAQAHGTKYKNKVVGSLSDLSIYSFYIAHNIQAGELGAINTNDREVVKLIRRIKANGRLCDCDVCVRGVGKCPKEGLHPRFTSDVIGYNFKTTEFSSAIAYTQIKYADDIKKKRNENVKYLNDELEKYSGKIKTPLYNKDVSYLAYPLLVNPKKIKREKIMKELESKGIETRILFRNIPLQQPSFSKYRKLYEGKLPNAEYVGNNGFYIGCHQYLNQSDLEYIVNTFKEIL